MPTKVGNMKGKVRESNPESRPIATSKDQPSIFMSKKFELLDMTIRSLMSMLAHLYE